MCGIQRKTDTKRIPGYERPAEKYDCEKIMMFIRSIVMGRDDAQCFVKLVLMMILLFIVVTTMITAGNYTKVHATTHKSKHIRIIHIHISPYT